MNKIDKIIFRIALAVLFAAATPMVYSQQILNYEQFMQHVKEKNIQYLVEKYNVDIAKANVEAAKVFPDPDLTLEGADNEERRLQMGYNVDAGLEYTLELGGKRKARMRLAQSEAELNSALLEDFFRNLRADATIAYYGVIYQKNLVDVKLSSFQQMYNLAQADSIRFALGSIMEIDAMQSKLEVNTLYNDVIESESELQNAKVQLLLYQGDETIQSIDSIAGELAFPKRDFQLLTLIDYAQNNRADMQAALKSKEVSQRNLQLAKANRAIDLGLSAGVSYNAEVRNEIAPAPKFVSVGGGISIPLKFSNANKGEIRAGKLAVEQSEANYRAVEQQIQAEVIQAHNKYVATCRQVERFKNGYMNDAEAILKNKIYSYQRGGTGLLEVLNAQRTYNDIRESYYETLYNCVVALVELQRAAGVWDD
jgi:cobalt-zinc-cadmium efflux system outer membrane protein